MAKTSVLTILFQLAKKGNADQKTIQGLAKLKSVAATAGLALGAMAGVGGALNKVYQNTAQVFLDNATRVRDLARSSGLGAEEASRLIQAGDDLGVSFETLQKSLWLANKNGFHITIASLSKMADEFVAIEDPTERADYLVKRFGKSSEEMGKMLEKGGDGLREFTNSVNGGQIFNENDLRMAREYELQLDSFKDQWEAIKISAGKPIVARLLLMFQNTNNIDFVREQLGMSGQAAIAMTHALARMNEQINSGNLDTATEGYQKMAQNAEWAAQGIGTTAEKMAEAAAEAERLADKQAQVMDVAFQLQDALNSYNEAMKEVDSTQKEAQITWDQAQKDYEKGLITKNDLIAAEQQYNTTMAETGAQAEAAAARHQEAMNRIVFSILQAQAAVDGLSVAESKALLNIGVKLNLIDQETADLATQMVNDFGKIEGGIREADGTLYKFNEAMYIARGYQGTYRYNFIIHTTGGIPNFGSGGGGNEEIVTNTGRGGQLIGFAEGGWLGDGWKVAGEKGYEFISPQGYVFTHEQSKALDAAGLVPGQKFAVGGDLMGGRSSGRRNSPITRLSGLGRRRVSSSSSTEGTDTASIAGASQQIAEVAETTAQNSASAQQDFVRVTESSLRATQASNQTLIEEVQKLNSNITVLQDQTVRAVRESTQAVMR